MQSVGGEVVNFEESVVLEKEKKVEEINKSLNGAVEKVMLLSKSQVKQELNKFYDFEAMQLQENNGVPSLVKSSLCLVESPKNVKFSHENSSNVKISQEVPSNAEISQGS